MVFQDRMSLSPMRTLLPPREFRKDLEREVQPASWKKSVNRGKGAAGPPPQAPVSFSSSWQPKKTDPNPAGLHFSAEILR